MKQNISKFTLIILLFILFGCEKEHEYYKESDDKIVSYQILNKTLISLQHKGKEINFSKAKFADFLSQQCPLSENSIEEDKYSYIIFFMKKGEPSIFKSATHCNIHDATVELRMASPGEVNHVTFTMKFYINSSEKTLNNNNIEFATNLLKAVTGIDDPDLISKLIAANLDNRGGKSTNEGLNIVVSEKVIDGYKVYLSRIQNSDVFVSNNYTLTMGITKE